MSSVAEAEAQLAAVAAGELEPHEVSALLAKYNYTLQSAVEAFLEDGRGALPERFRAPSNIEMPRESASKRPRGPDAEAELLREQVPTQSGVGVLAQNQVLGALADVTRVLQSLPEQLAKSLPSILRAHDEAERHRQQEDGEVTELQLRVGNCMNCDEIGKLPGLFYDAKFNVITCNNCSKYHVAYKGAGTSVGTRGKGGDITGPTQGRAFSKVKHKVKEHLGSPMHVWCEMHAAEESRREASVKQVGLNCARLVLQGVKEHDSDRSYERRIATEVAMGGAVGTKNHSIEFARNFKESLHDETASLIEDALTKPDPATGRPPPFACMADKATVMRETGQMHGVTVMLGGVLVAIMVSVLLCPDATGLGCACLIRDTMTVGKPLKLGLEQVRRSLTGLAFDGQYMSSEEGHSSGLQVKQHLCSLLGLTLTWVTARWDPAHRVELGMNTVREAIPWYGALAKMVSHANEKYLYGKAFARVKKDAESLKSKLASVGSVATTRFCASERKVYKSFARNLPILLRDMTGHRRNETGISQEIFAIANVIFVVQLFATIDLLQHVKNLSLQLQTVNQLPWELEEIIETAIRFIRLLGDDLKKGDVKRMLPPTPRSNGQQVPALEFLNQHLKDISNLKLHMYVDQLGSVASVDLQPSASRRISRATASAQEKDVSSEIASALNDAAKLAEKIADVLSERLDCPESEVRPLRRMSLCLDLRRMADTPAYAVAATAKPALEFLYKWLCSRMVGAPQAAAPQPQAMQRPSDMPPFEEVWKQFELLASRLRDAYQDHPYNSKWKGASGTVIMADVFTKPRFFHDCGDYLYLFQQMATKTQCEAVVEGMGSVWDQCTDPHRHPRFEVGAKEAVIAWTAPAAYLPEAAPFLSRALNRHFKGKPWNFTHTDMQLRQNVFSRGSKVVDRHRKDALRLPSAMYRQS